MGIGGIMLHIWVVMWAMAVIVILLGACYVGIGGVIGVIVFEHGAGERGCFWFVDLWFLHCFAT